MAVKLLVEGLNTLDLGKALTLNLLLNFSIARMALSPDGFRGKEGQSQEEGEERLKEAAMTVRIRRVSDLGDRVIDP